MSAVDDTAPRFSPTPEARKVLIEVDLPEELQTACVRAMTVAVSLVLQTHRKRLGGLADHEVAGEIHSRFIRLLFDETRAW